MWEWLGSDILLPGLDVAGSSRRLTLGCGNRAVHTKKVALTSIHREDKVRPRTWYSKMLTRLKEKKELVPGP